MRIHNEDVEPTSDLWNEAPEGCGVLLILRYDVEGLAFIAVPRHQ